MAKPCGAEEHQVLPESRGKKRARVGDRPLGLSQTKLSTPFHQVPAVTVWPSISTRAARSGVLAQDTPVFMRGSVRSRVLA